MTPQLSLFAQQSASKLSNTLVYEVQTGSSMLVSAFLTMTKDGLTVVALLGYLLYLNWKLTLIVLLLFPALVLVMRVLSRRLYKLTKIKPARHRRAGLCGGGKRAGAPHGAAARRAGPPGPTF